MSNVAGGSVLLPGDFMFMGTDSSVLPLRVQEEKARLQEACFCGIGSVYGSLYTGLVSDNLDNADLDIAFPLRNGPNDNSIMFDYCNVDKREMQCQRLAAIAQRLRAAGYKNVEAITRGASVPLVKCIESGVGILCRHVYIITHIYITHYRDCIYYITLSL